MSTPQRTGSGRLVLGALLVCFVGWCLWLISSSTTATLPQKGAPPLLYSNQVQQHLSLTLVQAIQQAQQSIHLVMFGLSDAALLRALGEKKIPTTVYFDPKGTPHLWSALPNATLHPYAGKGLMHQKILVLDQEMVFIGSANMTTPSLLMHDNLIVGLKDRKMAQFLIEHPPLTAGHFRTSVGGQGVEIWLLPDPQGRALEQLKQAIRSAQSSLKIALFTLTYPPLLDEVIHAHRRGLEVTAVIDFHSALGASKKAVAQLRKAGVNVLLSQGMQLLHHKFILLDDETLYCGSANWTKAAFYRNQDCLLILHHLTEPQRAFLDRLWRRIAREGRRPVAKI